LKIVAAGPQFDQISGVDEAIIITEPDVVAANITRCGARGANTQGSFFDAHLNFAVPANKGRRETFKPIRDLKGNAGFRRCEGMLNFGIRVSDIETIEYRTIRDFAREAHIFESGNIRMRSHQ